MKFCLIHLFIKLLVINCYKTLQSELLTEMVLAAVVRFGLTIVGVNRSYFVVSFPGSSISCKELI